MIPLVEQQRVNSANASRQGYNAFWTEERVDRLKEAALICRNARQIAEAVGDGCTCNMVIGKAKRMGIAMPGPKPTKEGGQRRRDAKEARRLAKIERKRALVAKLIGELIELERRAPSRVQRETSEAA